MLIQCEKCGTRYNLDESKIPGKGAKVTCPTCKNVFVVMKGGAAAPPAAAPAPAPPPTQSKSLLDNFFDDGANPPGTPPGPSGAPPPPPATPRGQQLRSWKVRVSSGLVYDFTEPQTLKAWIAEQKVTPADSISEDGTRWTVIGSIGDLDGFFGVTGTSPAPLGAPGPPPQTGFGPPGGGPAAPAFGGMPAPPGAGGPSLSDLFAMPGAPQGGPTPGAPTAPSFNAAMPGSFAPPPPPGADPFGANDPFGVPPSDSSTTTSPNPFGAAPPPAGPESTTTTPNPFGAAPPPSPGSGGGAPFGSDPFGADPFGGSPPPPAPQPPKDPFGSAPAPGAGPPPISPPPFAAPASPPPPAGWASESPSPPRPPAHAPPPPPPGAPPAPPPWTAGGPPPAAESSAPAAAPAAASRPAGKRNLGRTAGIATVVLFIAAAGAAFWFQGEAVMSALFPPDLPVDTGVAPTTTAPLEGAARAHYLAGRRYLRVDSPEAYRKAEEAFRQALEKAPSNSLVAAGVLEALALQSLSGAEVTEEAFNRALGDASTALKNDPRGVETNRSLAQYYVAAGHPEQAAGYLEAALAGRPDDPESLFLRGTLRSKDPATAAEGAADVSLAANEPDLTRAHRSRLEALPAGSPDRKLLEKTLASLEAENANAVAALDEGRYAFEPDEVKRLLPEPAEVVVAPTAETAPPTEVPSPEETAIAIVSSAPATATDTPAPTPTPTPAPATTERPVGGTTSKPPAPSPTPSKTAVAVRTAAPTATRPPATPTATAVAMVTPAPTPDFQIAAASAEDHFIAGQALYQAGSVGDAITEFRTAVESSPTTSRYKIALGSALLGESRRQEAAEVLVSVVEREPRNPEAHRLLGIIFEQTGQRAQACSYFTEYLRLAPTGNAAADVRARRVRNGCGG